MLGLSPAGTQAAGEDWSRETTAVVSSGKICRAPCETGHLEAALVFLDSVFRWFLLHLIFVLLK